MRGINFSPMQYFWFGIGRNFSSAYHKCRSSCFSPSDDDPCHSSVGLVLLAERLLLTAPLYRMRISLAHCPNGHRKINWISLVISPFFHLLPWINSLDAAAHNNSILCFSTSYMVYLDCRWPNLDCWILPFAQLVLILLNHFSRKSAEV